MKIIQRQEAIKIGAKRYYNGKLCINGHYSQRYTDNCQCLKCNTDKANKYYKDNKEKILAKI